MGTGIGEMVAFGIMSGIATNIIGNIMNPKPSAPKAPDPIEMPDPQAQQDAMREKILEQVSRSGRASTIMTSPSAGGGKLGG